MDTSIAQWTVASIRYWAGCVRDGKLVVDEFGSQRVTKAYSGGTIEFGADEL